MSRDENLAAQNTIAEAVNSGKLEDLVKVVATDSVDHDPAPGQVPGPAGFQAMFAEIRAAFLTCTSMSSISSPRTTSWHSPTPSAEHTLVN